MTLSSLRASLGCLQFQCLPKSMQWFFVSPSRPWLMQLYDEISKFVQLCAGYPHSPRSVALHAACCQKGTTAEPVRIKGGGGQNGWAKNHLKNFAINAAHWLQCPSSAVNVAVDVSVCINVQCAWFAESKCLRAHTHSHNAIYFCFGICCVSRFLFGLCSVCLFVCVWVIDSSSIDKSELRGRAERRREEVGLAHTARGRFIFCIIEMRLPKCSQKLCEPK